MNCFGSQKFLSKNVMAERKISSRNSMNVRITTNYYQLAFSVNLKSIGNLLTLVYHLIIILTTNSKYSYGYFVSLDQS